MESFNIRGRQKKVREEAKEASGKKSQSGRKKVIYHEVEEDSGEEVAGMQDLGEEKPTLWMGDERISLKDSDGEAMCHGIVVDAEPNLDVFGGDHKYVAESLQKVGWWIHVKLTHPTHNHNFTLDVDCVFNISEVLSSTARRIKSLCAEGDGVLMWWEYIVERQISPTKLRKSESGENGRKGSTKKAKHR